MNKPIILLLILTCSCKSVYLYTVAQNVKPKVDQTEPNSKGFVYENDSLTMTYNFWSEHGSLAFVLYNKLSIPIYVDWKKSSFIYNGGKFDYWKDQTNVSSVSQANSYQYMGTIDPTSPYQLFNISRSASVSLVSKDERVTFIPPHSYIFVCRFLITATVLPGVYLSSTKEVINPRNLFSKTCKVQYDEYWHLNTPLTFRNFLTFSTTEKFESEFYVDNSFYISSVQQLRLSLFESYEDDKMFQDSSYKMFYQNE